MSHTLLRQYRIQRRLTCEQMAKRLGIAESTLRSLENGTRPITAENAVEFEGKLDGDVTRHHLRPDLFGERPAKPKRTASAR